MKRMKSLGLSLAIITSINFSGCGESGSKINQTNKAASLAQEIQQLGKLSQEIDIPMMPLEEESKKTVKGVDLNKNGTRDDLEQITYQALNTLESINKESYDKVITVLNMIQPETTPVEDSIDKHKIYCTYRVLTENIKQELSLSFLYSLVLNTKERKTAFEKSLKPSVTSLGAETCE